MMMKFLAIVAAGLLLTACNDVPNSSIDQTSSNPKYPIRKLFTNEGCTAYRFYDDGRYRYYVVCSPEQQVTTTSEYSQMIGKITHTYSDEISTIQR